MYLINWNKLAHLFKVNSVVADEQKCDHRKLLKKSYKLEKRSKDKNKALICPKPKDPKMLYLRQRGSYKQEQGHDRHTFLFSFRHMNPY